MPCAVRCTIEAVALLISFLHVARSRSAKGTFPIHGWRRRAPGYLHVSSDESRMRVSTRLQQPTDLHTLRCNCPLARRQLPQASLCMKASSLPTTFTGIASWDHGPIFPILPSHATSEPNISGLHSGEVERKRQYLLFCGPKPIDQF